MRRSVYYNKNRLIQPPRTGVIKTAVIEKEMLVDMEEVNDPCIDFKCKKCGASQSSHGLISYMNFTALVGYLVAHKCHCGNLYSVVKVSYKPGIKTND